MAPASVKVVEATDANPMMIPVVTRNMAERGWPVKVQQMDSEKLEFGNDTFDYSITNFSLPLMQNPDIAAAEIYRTLKPGGTAAITWWRLMPQAEALTEAHKQIRAEGTKLKATPKEGFQDLEGLKKMLTSGGFNVQTIRTAKINTTFVVEDMMYFNEGMWTSIGEPDSGWNNNDEEEWDEAVKVMAAILAKHPGYKQTGANLEIVANVVIAQK